MKKVDIPSCIAVSRYPSYANHYLKYIMDHILRFLENVNRDFELSVIISIFNCSHTDR